MDPSRRFARLFTVLATLAVLVTACGGAATPAPDTPTPAASDPGAGWASAVGSTEIIPLAAWSQLGRGPERVLVGLVDRQNRLLAAPDVAVRLRFYDLAASRETPAAEADGVFFWAIEGARGLYHASVTFPSAGRWGLELTASRSGSGGSAPTGGPDPLAAPQSARMVFDVAERTSVPPIGAPAPASETPTLDGVGGDPARLSTDPSPDPRFYRLSVKEALAAKRPFLLVFATPAFCQSALCGPTMDVIRRVVADFPTLTVIHIEPYLLQEGDGQLQPVLDAQGRLQPVAAVTEWGLLSEPYTFLVAADGTVAARFEGPIDPLELADAIRLLGS